MCRAALTRQDSTVGYPLADVTAADKVDTAVVRLIKKKTVGPSNDEIILREMRRQAKRHKREMDQMAERMQRMREQHEAFLKRKAERALFVRRSTPLTMHTSTHKVVDSTPVRIRTNNNVTTALVRKGLNLLKKLL